MLAGMKIDRTQKPVPVAARSAANTELSRAHRVRRLMEDRNTGSRSRQQSKESSVEAATMSRQRRPPSAFQSATYVPIDLFGSQPFGIFTLTTSTTKSDEPKVPKLQTWDALQARDLKLSVMHPPANGFEEMIIWTEQGKLWKFPIDSEQGLDEEAKVPFHEHVFLQPQIEGWCPKKGPIRHFMELVSIGLSKNPFLTIQEKHQQTEWYHTYFTEKGAIIKEVGADEIK